MQALTELIPSTAVTHAVSLPFLNKKAVNLVVAKTSLLQIFEVHSFRVSIDGLKQNGNHNEIVEAHQSRLSLVAEYQLAGIITSLGAVRLLKSKSGGAALLVSFKDAKLSLVEWNPETYSLSTISIHLYEGEEVQLSPWTTNLNQCQSFLSVDPSNRCAALKFGQRHLAILPFRQQGDDLTMAEFDADSSGTRGLRQSQSRIANVATDAVPKPYGASFMLPLTALDASLDVPIDLAFLYEYREPTLGTLSCAKHAGPGFLQERKDALTYTIFTLDLEQHARTPLLTVTALPSDLFKIVPLPLPVGGTLLIGVNEVVHVDQAGKTHAIGVNSFTKHASSFPMSDQSSLELMLEGSSVVQLQKGLGDMLLITNSGDFAVLSFKMDGRSVSGLSIQRASTNSGGSLLGGPASCAVLLHDNELFVGAVDSDSLLIHCEKGGEQQLRKRSYAEMNGEDILEDEDIEDEDDLYGNDGSNDVSTTHTSTNGIPGKLSFMIQDKLPSLARFGQITISPNLSTSSSDKSTQSQKLTLSAPVGRGRGSKIAILSQCPRLHPGQTFESIQNATAVWCIGLDRLNPERLAENGSNHIELSIVVTRADQGGERSTIYYIASDTMHPLSGTDFEQETTTLDAGTMCNGTRLVQVCRAQLNCYDFDLGLAQIFPMIDEVTDAELSIVHTSFADPYLLVIRDDSSVVVLKTDNASDLEEIERGDAYLPPNGFPDVYTDRMIARSSLRSSNLETPLYTAESLCYLPPILVPDMAPRRAAARETLTEILVAELGNSDLSGTYLMVRTANDDIVMYRPFNHSGTDPNQSANNNIRWSKVPCLHNIKYSEDAELDEADLKRPSVMKALANLNGYKAVFVPGSKPSLIMKEPCSIPRAFGMGDAAIRTLSSYNTSTCTNGIIFADDEGTLSTAQLPASTQYHFDWAVRFIPFDQEIQSIAYHATSGLYVVGTTRPMHFQLPEDEWHREWVDENASFQPNLNQGVLKLVDPATWNTISELPLADDEIILCIETLELEVSEITGERQLLVAVGTSVIRGEDLQSTGNIHIFDIVTVVPEVDRPETNRKLKLIVREEVKGPVTAVSEIASRGYLIMSQGQKCMVRGLKEDNTLLPIAFLDVQTHVNSLKTLKGTGMTLVADAAKGVWFVGFSDEPNKMTVFGKGRSHMDVVATDFLPYGKELFVLLADADGNIHVLEYNPEHPKSLSGQRLLLKSTFHTGHFPCSMTLLPSTYSPSLPAVTNGELPISEVDPPGSLYQTLVTTQSGALLNITPLEEQTYRRLGALQNHLSSVLEQPCGLNPRAFRNVESEGFGSRGILDGGLLQRWNELGSQKKAEACTRAGAEEWQVRSDLEMIGGGGLDYL